MAKIFLKMHKWAPLLLHLMGSTQLTNAILTHVMPTQLEKKVMDYPQGGRMIQSRTIA